MDLVTGAAGFIGTNLVKSLGKTLKCDIKGTNSIHPTDLLQQIKDKKLFFI